VESGRSAGAGEETIDAATALEERLWLGLRTSEGARLEPQEQGALEAHPRFRDLVRAGLVTIGAGRALLTVRGFALADALAVELLALLAEAPCHA
jgi:coproporphyrinogen III oxidase-like Fe-S oxidoreductase